ncbi:MAG: DUF4097 family beta strand repeat-containing protein [Solirubrobacteraceae bacterium]
MSEHRFETPRPVRLEIKIAAGDISIASVDGRESTVTLEGSSRAAGDTRVELMGDRLVIEERRKGFMSLLSGVGDHLSVRVAVPEGSRVDVATGASDTRLDGSFASLSVASASGIIRHNGHLEGNASVKTANGDVRLEHVGGDLDVKTVSGHVVAEEVEGSVSVKSVSADLYVGSVSQGKVDVHSVSGDVTLGIAEGTCIDVDAGSASGELSSEIPLSADGPEGLGDRTVVIRVNTVSGDVLVRRAELQRV